MLTTQSTAPTTSEGPTVARRAANLEIMRIRAFVAAGYLPSVDNAVFFFGARAGYANYMATRIPPSGFLPEGSNN